MFNFEDLLLKNKSVFDKLKDDNKNMSSDTIKILEELSNDILYNPELPIIGSYVYTIKVNKKLELKCFIYQFNTMSLEYLKPMLLNDSSKIYLLKSVDTTRSMIYGVLLPKDYNLRYVDRAKKLSKWIIETE
jgi:hypothetical protein